MIVKQILTRKTGPDAVVTIRPDMTVADAARLLSERRIGAVVVSSDGATPDGILSERDIVRELGRSGASILTRKVSELMTSPVVTITAADHVRDVLGRMTEGRFRHLPVVGDDGRMVGVVSIGDAVAARLAQLSADREALQDMVMGR